MGEVKVNRTNGALGRKQPNEDAFFALLMNGIASGTVVLDKVFEFNSINDAEALGITAAYDTTNTVLCHYHISEFFRLCPNGKLFVMLVAQTVSLTTMADKATAVGLAKLLRDPKCKGKVVVAGIARNPATGYTPVTTGGLDNDSLAVTAGVYSGAVVKAQALAEEEMAQHRDVFIVVEGRSLNGSTANVPDLRPSSCEMVGLTIIQDKAVGDSNTLFAGHAAVGTTLGMIGARKVNECIGWVEPGNIQDAALAKFVTPGLSSNLALTAYTDLPNGDQAVLDGKGYIMPKTYVNYSGVYFNDSHTCAPVSDDYCTIENNRTMNKAVRKVYARLVPHVNAPQLVDAETGQLAPSVCKFYEALAEEELESMVKARECSAVDAYVDPAQNIIATDEFQVKVSITPTGKSGKIVLTIGFVNPFK